ncbi:hypothetical protein F66182_11432 [Fusarium sp. NRRL 66182]|nr:hypothetical protein F66182_11432 [Fusarium sp. NRRL 66182]
MTRKQRLPTAMRPFELLEGVVDKNNVREEIAVKCGVKDPNDVEDVYPCTPLQENMLAGTIRDPSAFISLKLYRIPSNVDLDRLRDAWMMVTVIRESDNLWVSYPDMETFLNKNSEQVMGPTTSLARWALIKEQDQHRLVWAVHHAIYDGWMLPLIENEVKKIYYGLEFGSILTGRNAPIDGIERVMGPTITTVPIMVDVIDGYMIQDYLRQIQDLNVRRMPYEHFGINEIRRINSSCKVACDFQTALVIQPINDIAQFSDSADEHDILEEIDETTVEGFPDQYSVLNQYSLMLELLPSGNKMKVRASFDSDVISQSDLERVLVMWEATIQDMMSAISRQSTTIGSLNSLCDQDLQDIWAQNLKPVNPASTQFVLEMISEIVKMQPNALAIDSWDGQMTYQTLEVTSSLLSDQLLSMGIGPGSFEIWGRICSA